MQRSRTARRRERVFEETLKVGFTRRRCKRLFCNRLQSFASRRLLQDVRPRKPKSANQAQRDKRRGLKVSNAFYDGPPGLPDGQKAVLEARRDKAPRRHLDSFSPSSRRRLANANEVASSQPVFARSFAAAASLNSASRSDLRN